MSAERGDGRPAGRPLFSFGGAVSVLNAIGTAWIFVLMLLINADVIGRGAFNKPILGVPEMVAFTIVGIVFLQLAHTLRIGALTRSDVLLAGLLRRAPRAGHALEAVFHLTGCVLLVILFYTTVPLLQRAYEDGDFYGASGVVQVPVWPLKVLMLIGGAAMAIQFALLAWRDLRIALGLIPPPPPPAVDAPPMAEHL